MKKNTPYIIAAIVFIAALAGIVINYTSKKAVLPAATASTYDLLPRKGVAADNPEWLSVKQQVLKLTEKIKNNPQDTTSLIQLAILFTQEARITGNHVYYDKAALQYVNNVLKLSPSNFEGLMIKGLIYVSQHHFSEGLDIAEKAKAANPYNSFVYGIITDANVELGNYKSAVENADKMASFRPDMKSYSRVAYLREIYGDYPGAIEAMQMAVDAGIPGEENTEWARIQLARLYENTGDLLTAEALYNMALETRPSYAYALAGLGKLAAGKKDYKKAVEYYQQAQVGTVDNAITEALAEVYVLSGDTKKADELNKEVIGALSKDSESASNDENIGHYSDMELAYLYLKTGDNKKALEHAMIEYNRRPDNNDVNECLAWIYYNNGDYSNAALHIKKAMQTNSKNPTLLCRAGLIFAKGADKGLAKATIQQGLNSNANIDLHLKTESMNILQSL